MSEEERDQIFISYSHKDKVWLERIRTHLSGAVRNRVIDPWDDSKIRPGSNWKDEIKLALARAKVAVILVSPNFLASEFIAQHEFPPLIEAAQKEGLTIFWILVSSCMYEDCGIQHYQAAHDIAKPLDQLKPADRNAVLTQICRKVRDAAAKPVRSFKEERFDKSPPERAYGSVLEDEASKGAIRWEDHLGHTYQGEPPAIMCQTIQLSGTNISGKPIRIEAARLVSKISDESVEVDIGTVDGWVRPEQMHSIRPDSKVTLRATFNAPKGLTAQQFINSWGQCAFLLTYNGVNEEIPISEEMTRALYENFRPEVIAPRPIQKAPNRMNWNRDGTIARSVKGHGYYRIKKQYVPEPGVEEERYLGWYQAGGHAFDPNGGFMPISGPIHGYKTLQEAQRACEQDDETTSRHLGL